MTVIVTFQMAGDQGLDWGFWRGDEKVKDLEMNREKWVPSVEEEAAALWPPK